MYQSIEDHSPTPSKDKKHQSNHPKYTQTYSHNLGNSKEELEFCDQSGSYDTIKFIRNSLDSRTTINAYKSKMQSHKWPAMKNIISVPGKTNMELH